jgi:hypothetical protein
MIVKLSFRRNQVLGITGILISLILLLFLNRSMEFVKSFALAHISQDGVIHPDSIAKVKFLYILFILAVSTLSLAFYFSLFRKAGNLIADTIETERIREFFLTDDLYQNKKMSFYMLLSGVVFALCMQFFIIEHGEMKKEGFFETFTAILFLITSVIFLLSGIKTKNQLFSLKDQRVSAIVLFAFSGLLLFMFLEEISYGQHMLGFETPENIGKFNYQDEFNFHNFLNPLFPYLYPIFGMGSFVIYFLISFFRKKSESNVFYLFFPSRSLFFLFFWMACSSFQGSSETFESLVGVTAFLWSIRIFKCLNFLKTEYPITTNQRAGNTTPIFKNVVYLPLERLTSEVLTDFSEKATTEV